MLKPKMKYDFSPNSHFLPKLFVKVRYFPRIVTTQDGSNIELPICVGKPRMYCAKGAINLNLFTFWRDFLLASLLCGNFESLHAVTSNVEDVSLEYVTPY